MKMAKRSFRWRLLVRCLPGPSASGLHQGLDMSSQETNLVIKLNPDAGAVVPIDSVCEQLLAEFPGAAVTAQSSFEARRLRLEELRKYSQERLRQGTLEPWSWKTMDELNEGIDMKIRHIRRAELTWGPQKDLAIPLGNGTQLEGAVGAKSLQFRGHCRPTDGTVANLVRLLESLNIGKVEILIPPSQPSCSDNLGQE